MIPHKARVAADQGRAYHDAGDYRNAIVAFKEAYVMAPSPGLLFNLAQAYRLQGNCDDASLMYRRYLGTAPTAAGRTLAEAHLTTVERCLRKRGLRIGADEAPHLAMGLPAQGQVLHARSADLRRARLQKDLGVGLTLGGAVAVGLALYYANDAYRAASELEAAYARGAKWREVEPIDERGERAATRAARFGVGGGLAMAGGVTLYLLGRRAERLAPLSITPTSHGAQVSLAWQY